MSVSIVVGRFDWLAQTAHSIHGQSHFGFCHRLIQYALKMHRVFLCRRISCEHFISLETNACPFCLTCRQISGLGTPIESGLLSPEGLSSCPDQLSRSTAEAYQNGESSGEI
jgi:hypothetical protein